MYSAKNKLHRVSGMNTAVSQNVPTKAESSRGQFIFGHFWGHYPTGGYGVTVERGYSSSSIIIIIIVN